MTVLVRDPMEQFTQWLFQMTQAAFVRSDSCGVILIPCSYDVNPKAVNELQSFFQEIEPELYTICFFDHESKMLGVVMENQTLAGTHYMSLAGKEFLERRNLQDGQMIVASFPESGESTERALSLMFQEAIQARGKGNEISLFTSQTVKKGISSILVVDTEELSREFIKLRLKLKGYEVYEAQDGAEALQKFQELLPDLVITELNLPIIDGYQFIHKIMEQEAGKGKVIVLTDKHLTKDMNRAFELGASDYVTKPFSITELEWRIKKL